MIRPRLFETSVWEDEPLQPETNDTHKPTALFFHGLNTFNDDILHLGPVRLGRMDRHFRPALEARGVEIHSIDGIGFGSPDSQARHASIQIANNQKLKYGATVDLLGNSLGGLVTRALAHLWKNEPEANPKKLQIGKLISWGTPHTGTAAADWIFTKNHETFRHCSPRALETFNRRYPLNACAPEFYFLCEASWRDISPYFWASYLKFAPSDGVIVSESQKWGKACGTFALDHFGQIGFASMLPLKNQQDRSRKEFGRLCDEMVQLIKYSWKTS